MLAEPRMGHSKECTQVREKHVMKDVMVVMVMTGCGAGGGTKQVGALGAEPDVK